VRHLRNLGSAAVVNAVEYLRKQRLRLKRSALNLSPDNDGAVLVHVEFSMFYFVLFCFAAAVLT
jgi:hypothetical protein